VVKFWSLSFVSAILRVDADVSDLVSHLSSGESR
jgi:hypothetical protein